MPPERKIAIITGCSSGIGLATTKLFLSSEITVFGIDISPFPDSTLPANFHFHQTDLLKPKASFDAVAECVSLFGHVEILANVAGIMDTYQSADTITDESWDRVMGINLTVPVTLMREALGQRGMKERKKGYIVNVASKSGLSGAAAGIAYTASKHALVGATKNVAWRFRNMGIRCNAVCPGGVATNIGASMDKSKFDIDAYNEIKPVHQVHRHPDEAPSITVDDIARSILYLSSDSSAGVNGVILPVDNGWSTV